MGMKRHGSSRKQVLDLDNSKDNQRLTWKSKYEQICAVPLNGLDVMKPEEEKKPSALVGLSGYLSTSDSEDSEDSVLNEEVKKFIKEVDSIQIERKAPSGPPPTPKGNPNFGHSSRKSNDGSGPPTVAWQECFDSSTGFTYYWNVETNEVTWDMPIEYQKYMDALKQWQQIQAQTEVAALIQQAKAKQLQHQQQQKQQQEMMKQHVQEQLGSSKHAEFLKVLKKAKMRKKKRKKNSRFSDSEDDKIELITSYGPNSGDESSSDPEQRKADKEDIPAKKKRLFRDTFEPVKKENVDNSLVMGPQLPSGGKRLEPDELTNHSSSSLVPYHPDADSDPEESHNSNSSPKPLEFGFFNWKPNQRKEPVKEESGSARGNSFDDEDEDESTLLNKLRNKTQMLQELGGEVPEDVKNIISEKEETCADSEEDSKKIELSSELKQKLAARAKQLVSSSLAAAKTKSTLLAAIEKVKQEENRELQQMYDLDNSVPSPLVKSDDASDSPQIGSKRKLKLELPTRPKSSEELSYPESGKEDLKGLGFVAQPESQKRVKADKIMFVKAETLQFSEENTTESDPPESSKIDIKDVSSLLLDKMKFLSSGKEAVSPVQIWAIQLETLLSAWESHHLKENYLENWLASTTAELERLESTVAPDGWACEWQRSEKCYSYRNLKSNAVVWEFPQEKDEPKEEDKSGGGGEEDMEVCTTPPPPPSPPRISPLTPPPPPAMSPPLPQSTPSAPKNAPGEVMPPLPPLPPPPPSLPPSPPPPPPDEPPPPPPPLHITEPLPPGVDPPEILTALPPLPQPDFIHMQIPLHHGLHIIPQIHYPMAYPAVTLPAPAGPPLAPVPHPTDSHNLSSEIDNFYNDIASLEPEPQPPLPPVKDQSPPPLPPTPVQPPLPETTKKKKKTKLAPGLALKKKGVSSLVAKWQQVQEDVRRDLKNIDD